MLYSIQTKDELFKATEMLDMFNAIGSTSKRLALGCPNWTALVDHLRGT